MTARARRGTLPGRVAALGLVAVLGVGCATGADMSDAQAPAVESDGGAAGEMADEAPAFADDPDAESGPVGEAADGGNSASVEVVSVQAGRRVVRTATLVLEVEDGASAADEVTSIAQRRGGFVAETDLSRDLDGLVTGAITLRVPADALLATVEDLDELAVAAPVKRIDERDVTAESTDLRATLTNLEAYETELRTLLADVRETTTRPDDLLTVFERIRSVRAEIDRAEARLDTLDDQVELSTVHVTLSPAASAVPVVDPGWAPSETVRDALTTTARGLSAIADLTIRLALTVVPIGALLLVPVAALAALWKRTRARHVATGPGTPSA